MVINKEFIQELQSDQGTGIIGTGDIVPKALTHSYILRNNQPNKIVYDNYCINGLLPYSMVINGAYHRRDDLVNKLKMILHSKNSIYLNDKEIKYFSDLDPYFKDYADGFKVGFNEFDNDIIKPYLILLADKTDYTNKVFEYITKKPWWNKKIGFSYTFKDLKDKKCHIVEACDDGKKQGYLYKAWSIILANQNHFIKLFSDLAQDAEQPREPQQPEKPKYRISAKHHVMADIFERHATGQGIPIGKNEREAACKDRAKKCTKQECKPNTFYKNYNRFTESGTDINKESDLIKYFGEDWQEILLYITTEPVKVKEYLQDHQI